MAHDATLTVHLVGDMAESVRGSVRWGEYASEQEAIEAAVLLWRRDRDRAAVRRRTDEALASVARGEGYSPDEIEDWLEREVDDTAT